MCAFLSVIVIVVFVRCVINSHSIGIGTSSAGRLVFWTLSHLKYISSILIESGLFHLTLFWYLRPQIAPPPCLHSFRFDFRGIALRRLLMPVSSLFREGRGVGSKSSKNRVLVK
jgi:hypothetical protein